MYLSYPSLCSDKKEVFDDFLIDELYIGLGDMNNTGPMLFECHHRKLFTHERINPIIPDILLFIAGLLALYYGAEWLVNGAAGLVRDMGFSPIIIGLTVVAFGTSAPEMVVSVVSSIQDRSMIAVGNVIGSNICNIALVLGLSAFLQPIESDRSVVRREIPIMIGVSFYLLIVAADSTIGRFEGLTLFGGIILYIGMNCKLALNRCAEKGAQTLPECSVKELSSISETSKPIQLLLIVAGIATVVVGAEFLVNAAVNMMKTFGVSEKFIGLTVVAFGTSLPELATSVVAAMKGEMDISIGNLIGSNVFNILSVLGIAALFRPIHITGGFFESGLIVDFTVMMAVSVFPLIMMRKDAIVSRVNGLVLLICYSSYVSLLVFKN